MKLLTSNLSCNNQQLSYFVLQMRMNNTTDGEGEPRGERFVTHVDLTEEVSLLALDAPHVPKTRVKVLRISKSFEFK